MSAEARDSTVRSDRRSDGGRRTAAAATVRRFVIDAIPPLTVLVLLLTTWEVAARTGRLHPILYPPPSQVVAAFGRLVTETTFFSDYALTIRQIIAGYALGVTVGFTLGSVFTLLPRARVIFYPYFIAFQALPKVVLAPLFIVWLGFGPASKIAMALAISFFPILINTMLGLSLVDEDRLRLMRSLLASDWVVFRKLKLPAAMPSIFAGLKTGLTLAVFGTIAAELVGSTAGVGTLIKTYDGLIRVDYVIALVVSLGVFGLLVYVGMERLDRRITFWSQESTRGS